MAGLVSSEIVDILAPSSLEMMATVYTHKVPAASAGSPLPSRLDRKREKPLREKIWGEDISAPQHFGVNFNQYETVPTQL